MMKILLPVLVSLLVLCGVEPARAQDSTSVRDSVSAPVQDSASAPIVQPAGPLRTDTVPRPGAPCVRQLRRVPPPPSPRRFRQWPVAALGAIAGWFVGDRLVGPKGNPLVIISGSTVGAIAGSHLQAASEGHANLGRSVMGGVLGALPAGALVFLNQMDTYDEAEILTRGVMPVLGGSVQAAVTAGVTSSSLQPTRIQIIECPHR